MSSLDFQKALGITDKKLTNVLHHVGKTTFVTDTAFKISKMDAKLTPSVVLIVAVVGGCVGMALCDVYGRKDLDYDELKNSKRYEDALQRRFGLGVGTGIFAGVLFGPLALVVVGLILLFMMGVNKTVTYEHHKGMTDAVKARLETRHLKQTTSQKYYTGVLAGTLLGLVVNRVIMHSSNHRL